MIIGFIAPKAPLLAVSIGDELTFLSTHTAIADAVVDVTVAETVRADASGETAYQMPVDEYPASEYVAGVNVSPDEDTLIPTIEAP